MATSIADDKVPTELIEEKLSPSSTSDDLHSDTPADWTKEEEARIVRRVDRRLLPILGAMYAVSLIDRTNLGLAAIAGMNKELELTGNRYTVIIMLFFVMYIIFEIPSNLVLPRAGPANWLAFLGVGFGAVLIGMGFTHSYAAMAVCRALLGILEAGFMPGCTFLITCWYRRFEVGKRLGFFWIVSVIAGGFASIFAYVLTLMAGLANMAGWRWIFIIQGIITVVLCALGWFIIVDFPAKAKFLNARDRHIAVERINKDRGDGESDKLTFNVAILHLRDPKLYLWSIMLLTSSLPGYAYTYFLPIILKDGMGFTTAETFLLGAPPAVSAAAFTILSSWIADKYKIRGPIISFHQVMTVTGMCITAFAKNQAVRLFGAYWGISFLQFCIPGVLAYQANNIVCHSKRSLAAATCMIGGGIGGILAAVVFKAEESPIYETGVYTCAGFTVFSIGSMAGMTLYFYKQNKKIDAGELILHGQPGWRYTY